MKVACQLPVFHRKITVCTQGMNKHIDYMSGQRSSNNKNWQKVSQPNLTMGSHPGQHQAAPGLGVQSLSGEGRVDECRDD